MQTDRSRRTYRAALGAILLAALAARVGWGLAQPSDDASLRQLPDQAEYLTLAGTLLGGQGLHFFDDRFAQAVYAYRMPGYPAFLAACLGRPLVARLAQAAVDTSTVLAVALLARMLLPGRAGRSGALVAAGLVAVNPYLVFFTGLLLSETLFTGMLAWGMVLLVAGGRGGRFGPEPAAEDGVEPASPSSEPVPSPPHRPVLGTLLWLLGGLTIAASALVRPSAPPLTVILGVLAAFAAKPPRPRSGDRLAAREPFRPRWPLPVAATMLLLSAAVLAPWAYRNSLVVGAWVWTTTNGGVTAYDGFNPDATGASDQTVLRSLPQLRSMTEVARSDYLSARAAEFVRDNPRRALQLAVAKAARTWSPVPLSDEYGGWRYWAVGLGYTVPLYVLVVLGIYRGSMRRAAKVYLLAPAAYFTLVHMASVGSLRYRIPVEPPLAVVAASGLSALRGGATPWRRAGGGEVVA